MAVAISNMNLQPKALSAPPPPRPGAPQRLENPYFEAIVGVARFVAHGLGNPLTGLSLSLELLHQTALPSGQDRLVSRCERVTARLTRIKDNLSALAGGMGDPDEEVEPHAFLGDVVVPGLRLPEAYQLAVRVADDVLSLQCHPNLLAEAIGLVVTNATDAMPDGGALGIDVIAAEGGTLICVWDEGGGFSEDAMRWAGRRPITTKLEGGGMGLLWTTLIVEVIHQGRVTFGRRRRGGAEVQFFLPQHQSPPKQDETA